MSRAIANTLSPSRNAASRRSAPASIRTFTVELVCQGPIAAVVSRVSLDQFAPERLLGKTAEDIEWLGKIAARHNEIICQAASSSAVLPLRLGTVFCSRDSLQAMLVRCQPIVVKLLEQLGNRQEWGVKLYLEKRYGATLPAAAADAGALPTTAATWTCRPARRPGTAYLTEKKAQLDSRRELRSRRVSDDSRRGKVFGRQSRTLLPHPQSPERPDRPQRRNGLQCGFPAAPLRRRQVGWRPSRTFIGMSKARAWR